MTSLSDIGLLGGLLTGLAGSLHCVGLCGGISTSLTLASLSGGRGRATMADALSLQLGRVAAYAVLGMLAGSGGAAFGTLLDMAGAHAVLRLLAAASLVLTGLSSAGAIPALPLGRLSEVLRRLRPPAASTRRTGPFVMGFAWGWAPCPMVHGALLTAMLTGSPAGGATFMAGFGAATVLPLVAATTGAVSFARQGRRTVSRIRAVAGWTTVGLGLATLVEPAGTLGQLCLG